MDQSEVMSAEMRRVWNDAVEACISAAQAVEHGDGVVWWERFRDNPEDPDEVTVLVDLADVVVSLREIGRHE